MRTLVGPTTELVDAWREAHADWGPGRHEDGFGLRPTDDVASEPGFAAFVQRLRDHSDPAVPLAPGRVPTSYWWMLEDRAVVGGIALRHRLEERHLVLGHVGYGVRPTARRRGLATWALGEVLTTARTEHGLDRVLLVCEEGNAASAAVIERCGGVLEDVRDSDDGRIRRSWVSLVPGVGAETEKL